MMTKSKFPAPLRNFALGIVGYCFSFVVGKQLREQTRDQSQWIGRGHVRLCSSHQWLGWCGQQQHEQMTSLNSHCVCTLKNPPRKIMDHPNWLGDSLVAPRTTSARFVIRPKTGKIASWKAVVGPSNSALFHLMPFQVWVERMHTCWIPFPTSGIRRWQESGPSRTRIMKPMKPMKLRFWHFGGKVLFRLHRSVGAGCLC